MCQNNWDKHFSGGFMLNLKSKDLEKIAIDVKSQKILNKLLLENPKLESIMRKASNEEEAKSGLKKWVMEELESRPNALKFFRRTHTDRNLFESLKWREYAAIRLLDYIENSGREFSDLNKRGKIMKNKPIKLLWLATNRGVGRAKPDFFKDMLYLFRQFTGRSIRKLPRKYEVYSWMDRYPAGFDARMIKLRRENRDRILKVIIDRIDRGEIENIRYQFKPGLSYKQKFKKALIWWDDWRFHYTFAVRSPDLLNEMLENSLDDETMDVLFRAQEARIPIFVNPYYLSLLQVQAPEFAIGADLAIRDYVIYSKQLIEEFGNIVAWEKEDEVKPGKPNAAGWILPNPFNIHRRYPEVAIFIPESMGRACGGLCTVCQRMYNFQSGYLNFDLDKLAPHETWEDKLNRLMKYFEKDSQLRDILITGGDALMSSDKSLKKILNAVYNMARNKRKANQNREDGEKYAEIVRVRLGTRLPVYLPQRITIELTKILADFKQRCCDLGIRQFVIQTHFVSPAEVTPEARESIRRLISAGWTVNNQLVFTAAASRRGHTAKLRKVLNDIGVLTYYTFSVKGYRENVYNFATNARAVQEQSEEKMIGRIPKDKIDVLKEMPLAGEEIVSSISKMRNEIDIPFLATDRNVINLPGVGKSMTFRVIGITHDGRRILEFDHDVTRNHSLIIKKMGKVVIIESKSIGQYLRQLEDMGEDVNEYKSIYGYSIGETEPLLPIYKYPKYDFKITEKLTNFAIET